MVQRVRFDESGLALVTVLLAMALVTVIGAALTAVGIVEFRSSINHRSATRALLLADAGATHAQALLRGPLEGLPFTDVLLGADGVADTEDDGLLIGFGLDSSDELPDSGIPLGAGRYFVTIINDPGDPSGSALTDDNHRFIAVGRGETFDGGIAEVRVLLAAPAFPAIAAEGQLHVPGNPVVLGPCAGVHSNKRMDVSGKPIVDGDVTSADTVVVAGEIKESDGDEVTPRYEPPVDIPDLNPLDLCYAADYELKDGWVVTIDPDDASRDSSFAVGVKVLGWQWDAPTNMYQLTANDAVEGTVCAHGNIKVTGNLGSAADTFNISLLSTGSVQVGGTPVVEADHPEDYLIVAEGDVKIGGTAAGTTPYYGGTIYAGSQCQLNGVPVVDGNLLCYDAADPADALDLFDENKVNGTPTITYDCTGKHRRTLVAAWWEARTNQ